MSEKILVTGGSGFLGAALVKRLVSSGKSVVVLDDNSRGAVCRLAGVKQSVQMIEGDVRDAATVLKAAQECDAIFHLAFVNGTRFFYEKPALVLDVGIRGALSAIDAALACQASTFVLASSSEVYHQPLEIPTTELETCRIPEISNPRYSYAGGKLISELLVANFFREDNIRDLIFRPHNVFGPDMGEEHVIPQLVAKLFEGSSGFSKRYVDLQIEGNGDETRAFCFIDDAIDQIVTVYDHGRKGEIYNVGVCREISIGVLVDEIAKILGLRVNVIPSPRREGGATRRCPDVNKVMSLGYKPRDSFSRGLEQTVEWYAAVFRDNRQKKTIDT